MSDRTAIVTGAAAGIGRATAEHGAVANVTIDVHGSVSRLNPAVPGYGF